MPASSKDITDFFEKNQGDITQERNDFLVPQILDFVETKRWINVAPEYQRRQVWSAKKKSRLIESLFMNVPIPPIYLYERDYNRYEVMDGQQRINTIVDFYQDRLRLTSLESWKILNGLSYRDLPDKVQRGLDRRRVGAAVIISDLSERPYGPDDIRRQVFDRLNTGGLQLQAQELRNCLFPGEFNQLLVRLSSLPKFTKAFGIPGHKPDTTSKRISSALAKNNLFKRMKDCEYVLRFFAFRKPGNLKGAIPKILDRCMEDYLDISAAIAEELGSVFESCLDTAVTMFGNDVFHLPGEFDTGRASLPLYDATMVAINRLSEHKSKLVAASSSIQAELETMLNDASNYDVVIGKPGTAKAMDARLDLITDLYVDIAGL